MSEKEEASPEIVRVDDHVTTFPVDMTPDDGVAETTTRAEDDDVDFADAEETEETSPAETQEWEGSIPSRYDKEWTDYVLSHVELKEMPGGMPRVDVLRRLVERFIGHIVRTDVDVQYHFNPTDGRPVVLAKAIIVVDTGDDSREYEQFTGVADASLFNTGDAFRKYLAAISETRAKGRAYKEALMLQGVVTEEEVGFNKKQANYEGLEEDPMSDSQLSCIERLCKECKITPKQAVEKFLEKGSDLDHLTNSQCVYLIRELNQLNETS
jgi:hypothetical protein